MMNDFTNKDEVSLTETGFKIAFGVMDYDVAARATDPDFVRYQVFLEVRRNLQIVRQDILDYHLCTQDDFDSFYDISINNAGFAKQLLQDQILFCIDEDDLVIRGADEIDSVALNIDYTTCDRSKGGKCAEMTKESLKDYLGHPELIIMYNQQRFDNSVYNDATIVNEAVIWNQHINKDQTNWMLTQYTTCSVEDEIAYMDVGIIEPREFH